MDATGFLLLGVLLNGVIGWKNKMKTFNFDIRGKVKADSRENATATLKTAMIEGDIKDYTIDELVEAYND